MHLVRSALIMSFMLLPVSVFAQSTPAAQASTAPSIAAPRLINLSGAFRPADGQPIGRTETVTFAVYADEVGGAPIWQETQTVEPDASGRYTVLLGATRPDGVPLEVFASGEARWLGMLWGRGGASEARRSRLTFVPYALRAADADTLGGKPASAYALATPAEARSAKSTGGATDETTAAASGNNPTPNAILPGSANYLTKYVNGSDVGSSAAYDAGGRFGFNTTLPADILHAQFTNNDGSMTGLAVQNLGGTTASYSGMLFLDPIGTVVNFQGFNNSTHEYRINNVAKNVSSQFNGTINFMTGSTSRFFVATNGNIGMGTTAPSGSLEVSNQSSANVTTSMIGVTYNSASFGGTLISGRRYRGTSAAPTAVLSNDILVNFRGTGYTGTGIGTGGASIIMRALDNWTAAAQGAWMEFATTPSGTASSLEQMRLTAAGNLGVGTQNPGAAIDVVRTGGDAVVQTQAFGVNGVTGPTPAFFAVGGRGTSAAPTAILSGDLNGFFGTGGHDGSDFYGPSGGLGVIAMENWTPTAHGAASVLLATPIGGNDPGLYVAVLPNGNVGIGTPGDANGVPTAADRLQVFGDIRVGTSGTNGCINNFAGTGIAGSCSSDLRLKKDITPIGAVLDKLAALQPVHFFWRAAEFPDRHFGNSQATGLIAQDVEQVLPELVETQADGFKAVNYSALPLLTLQAVKELKSENDALKAEVDPLKHRVAELERKLTELLAAMARR